jgi:hypothetical protein
MTTLRTFELYITNLENILSHMTEFPITGYNCLILYLRDTLREHIPGYFFVDE